MLKGTYVFALLLPLFCLAQPDLAWQSYLADIQRERVKTDSIFSSFGKSPLDSADIAAFHGLSYFPANNDYRIEARFTRNRKREKFAMVTTTSRAPVYRRHGKIVFELEGQACTLQVYQNVDLVKKKKYRNHLFIPFTDATNGEESYGGGRYLDIELNPKLKEASIILDFNKAYNPYCAYSHRWSCPIPPRENDLSIRIEAGVKSYGTH